MRAGGLRGGDDNSTVEWLNRLATLLGRDFGTEAGGAPPASTVIIGHRLWGQYFDSDPSILDRTIRLNNRVFDIIGVAPPDRSPPPCGCRSTPGSR